MQRTLTSLGVILALIVVLTGGSCLACSDMLSKAKQHDCCKKSSHCPMPMKKAPVHEECASPATDLSRVEHSLNAMNTPVAAPSEALFESIVRDPLPRISPPGGAFVPYSPPDLCLLNSVLTI